MGSEVNKVFNGSEEKVGGASDYEILNPGEQSIRNKSLANLGSLSGNYNNILAGLTSNQMNSLLGSYGNIGQNITNAANAFGNINYDPEAANRALLNNMSGYSNAAQLAANQALSGSNQSARELAGLATQDAMRASANELANAGLLGSGAANQSMLEAAYTPQAQLQSDLANMQASYQGNVLNSLMGSGANLLGTGYATQNQNSLAAAQAGLTGAQSQLDVTNSAVNSQLQNILAQLQGVDSQGNLYANLANLTQQQYTTPQYVHKPGVFDYAAQAANTVLPFALMSQSDKRVKRDISELTWKDAEEFGEKLKSVTFRYIPEVVGEKESKKLRVGFLADDLEQTVCKDNVVHDREWKEIDIAQQTLSNTGFIALLIQEVSKLRAELSGLKGV